MHIARSISTPVNINHIELIHIDSMNPCAIHIELIHIEMGHSDPYQLDSHRLRLIANLHCSMGPVDKGLRGHVWM